MASLLAPFVPQSDDKLPKVGYNNEYFKWTEAYSDIFNN
ncbi:hypothetical protein Vi05172_g5542 [Venturia inaequalis]|nr:hypothetical protein Vi05172_g5542 [Venturia inaequalis]